MKKLIVGLLMLPGIFLGSNSVKATDYKVPNLAEKNSQQNLIVNGNFESGLSNWSYFLDKENIDNVKIIEANGFKYAQLTSKTASSSSIAQSIDVSSLKNVNVNFKASSWIIAAAVLNIQLYDKDEKLINDIYTTATGNDWQRRDFKVNVENASRMKLNFRVNNLWRLKIRDVTVTDD